MAPTATASPRVFCTATSVREAGGDMLRAYPEGRTRTQEVGSGGFCHDPLLCLGCGGTDCVCGNYLSWASEYRDPDQSYSYFTLFSTLELVFGGTEGSRAY